MNHRRAAHGQNSEFEGLSITPVPLHVSECPDKDLVNVARNAWDKLSERARSGVIEMRRSPSLAPTGTIGLIMDCDTTGIEPDFAYKIQKLAGGGYFKIINSMVPLALQRLGYSEEQRKEIIDYAVGRHSLEGCPGINPDSLRKAGFSDEKIALVEKHLSEAFDIKFVFNEVDSREEFCLKTLGIER